MKKSLIKKCLSVAAMLVLTTSVFAAKNPKKDTSKTTRPDVWILDLADGCPTNSGANFWHDDNTGDSGYSYIVDFTANTAFALPRKGEKVRVTGKIISKVDMPYVAGYFNDDTKGWKSLSWTELLATNLKAGVPVEIDKEFEIQDDSNGKFRFELQYDLCWGDYAGQPKIEKSVGFSFERSNESTDSYAFKTSNAEKWVIDYCDSDTNPDGVFIKDKNSPLYTFDRKYDALFLGVLPRKGDFIEVNIQGVSDTDIPHLNIQLVDNSEAANWWQDISTTYWPSITNIKAGVPFSAKLLFPVDNPPKGTVMVRFHYDGDWEKEWRTTPDVGKPVKFTFERSVKSFDLKEMCAKTGVKNAPKVYNLDLADSDAGSAITIEWDNTDGGQGYRKIIGFRELLKGDMPKKGDYIVFSYDMTFSEDIPYLVFQMADCSKMNYWNQAYKPDYFDFNDIKAGEHICGKAFVQVKDTPIYDANVQIIYDSPWQRKEHPVAGTPVNISFNKAVESTDTVKRHAPKTYKLDITKLVKNLNFVSVDSAMHKTDNQAYISAYAAEVDITSLFKKGDFPLKGDTVELTYQGALPQDFGGIFLYLYEENDYIWKTRLGANLLYGEVPVINDMRIEAGKKIKYVETIVLTKDADLAVKVLFGCAK